AQATRTKTGARQSRVVWRADDAERASAERGHGSDALAEIDFRHFSSARLRNCNADVFHRVRSRHDDATVVGRTGILVLFVRRGPLADRIHWFAATHPALRFRTRTDACALGLVNGRPRQPV